MIDPKLYNAVEWVYTSLIPSEVSYVWLLKTFSGKKHLYRSNPKGTLDLCLKALKTTQIGPMIHKDADLRLSDLRPLWNDKKKNKDRGPRDYEI